MHIYAFGSICRGEIDSQSDVDILVIGGEDTSRYDPSIYSVYSYDRMKELWKEGNPFAWHLFLESRLLFASDGQDFLHSINRPAPYREYANDCRKFFSLFCEARTALNKIDSTIVFELSTIFLSIRNMATFFSLGVRNHPDFSRSSAIHMGADSVPICNRIYRVLERARILCTRGRGREITSDELKATRESMDQVYHWMNQLVERAVAHERV
jgi:hypothetical protein